jgi:hypothetical protein
MNSMAFGVNIKNWMDPTSRIASVHIKTASSIKRMGQIHTGSAQNGAEDLPFLVDTRLTNQLTKHT